MEKSLVLNKDNSYRDYLNKKKLQYTNSTQNTNSYNENNLNRSTCHFNVKFKYNQNIIASNLEYDNFKRKYIKGGKLATKIKRENLSLPPIANYDPNYDYLMPKKYVYKIPKCNIKIEKKEKISLPKLINKTLKQKNKNIEKDELNDFSSLLNKIQRDVQIEKAKNPGELLHPYPNLTFKNIENEDYLNNFHSYMKKNFRYAKDILSKIKANSNVKLK